MHLNRSVSKEGPIYHIQPYKEIVLKGRVREITSKMLEVVLEEKRREIIKEWIDSGRIKDINSNVSSDKEVIFYPEGKEQPGGFKMNKI